MRIGGEVPLFAINPRRDYVGITPIVREIDDDLTESMKNQGLLRPIILDAETYEVVDGQRRLIVAHNLGWDTIQAVTVNEFITLARYLKETRKFEDKNIGSVPFARPKLSEMILILGTLKRIKERDLDRYRRLPTKDREKLMGPFGGRQFDELMADTLGITESLVSRLVTIGNTWHKAPASLSSKIEELVSDLDKHGMAGQTERLVSSLNHGTRRPVETRMTVPQQLARAERIITALETMSVSVRELVQEIRMANGPINSDASRALSLRLRRAQYAIGRLSGALSEKAQGRKKNGSGN